MTNKKRVAIAGFGAIGKELARRLIDGSMPDFELSVIGARDPAKPGPKPQRS